MCLHDRFTEYIKNNRLFPPGDTLLVAVSGGVDSVVLCELCFRSKFPFAIAHCNFRLRGEESERDKEFVCELAARFNAPLFVRDFDTSNFAAENKLSIQEAARKLRYDWFRELTSQPGTDDGTHVTSSDVQRQIPANPKWILTAHHADDNIETMLMNFFRGTGIRGLRGILPKQGNLIRPLLPFRKAELLEFATGEHLRWVEDSSNESDKYSRNYFRINVIPLVKNVFPGVEENLLNNLRRFSDIEKLYRQSIDLQLRKLLEYKGNEIHVPLLKLKKCEAIFSVVYEMIKPYDFTVGHVQDVLNLADSESGRYIQSSTHRVFKNRNWLIITPVMTTAAENILIEESDSEIKFALGNLRLQKQTIKNPEVAVTSRRQATNHTTFLNAEEITYPLLLRKWRAGDYFYPLGMHRKKKKVARFLIDQKLSKSDKENVWVLETDRKIVWVVGMRIDERFKVISESKPVLSLTLERPDSR